MAALLPGVDPVTMLIEMVPLIVLFELSIVLASVLFGRSGRARAPAEPLGRRHLPISAGRNMRNPNAL